MARYFLNYHQRVNIQEYWLNITLGTEKENTVFVIKTMWHQPNDEVK